MPIGHIYFRNILFNHYEILTCYVEPHFRRKGICTQMFSKLKSWYPGGTFITQQGNKQSTPWLLKMGFEKRADGWWLVEKEKAA